ncbi:MAG: M18 family aminopeptidase [Oscillospiraceae bacterium]|jgi:aspartyl aminopeptidase|nr:M18 family aminopeptidase [Oscillospiraceae bacterium]
MYEQISTELLDFLKKSPTCYHVIANLRAALVRAGYTELSEGSGWNCTAGGKYFVVRNESSLIAFRIPAKDFTGYQIAASHSDSPSFKVKENPEMDMENLYVKLNVEKYGGMLCAPWLDRPLSVAGKLIVREGSRFVSKLVSIDRDLLMIPSLAIHMDRKANDGHAYNPQKDMLPVLGDSRAKGRFMDIVAESAGIKKEDIAGSDLFLYSRTPGTVWGAEKEYISAGRLDDLECTYGDFRGFLDARENPNSVPVFTVFDNEEVGSGTKQGADSTFLADTLERIGIACGRTPEQHRTAIASSFMVSADNAHAVHPNSPDKADPVNRPHMNGGIVIKYNANQKYTTDSVSAAIFKEVCGRAKVPWQEFTNRSDMPGGSTLGNISNAHISLNTVDIGLAQLAMHSPYETAGSEDTAYLARAMREFFSLSLMDEGQGNYSLH